jgi:hypothetical protein
MGQGFQTSNARLVAPERGPNSNAE